MGISEMEPTNNYYELKMGEYIVDIENDSHEEGPHLVEEIDQSFEHTTDDIQSEFDPIVDFFEDDDVFESDDDGDLNWKDLNITSLELTDFIFNSSYTRDIIQTDEILRRFIEKYEIERLSDEFSPTNVRKICNICIDYITESYDIKKIYPGIETPFHSRGLLTVAAVKKLNLLISSGIIIKLYYYNDINQCEMKRIYTILLDTVFILKIRDCTRHEDCIEFITMTILETGCKQLGNFILKLNPLTTTRKIRISFDFKKQINYSEMNSILKYYNS